MKSIRIEQFSFRAPTGRQEELFSVVPFEAGAKRIKFISKHRAMIAELDSNTLKCSKRIHSAPTFIYCHDGMGGVEVPLCNELKNIIKNLTPKRNMEKSHGIS